MLGKSLYLDVFKHRCFAINVMNVVIFVSLRSPSKLREFRKDVFIEVIMTQFSFDPLQSKIGR